MYLLYTWPDTMQLQIRLMLILQSQFTITEIVHVKQFLTLSFEMLLDNAAAFVKGLVVVEWSG